MKVSSSEPLATLESRCDQEEVREVFKTSNRRQRSTRPFRSNFYYRDVWDRALSKIRAFRILTKIIQQRKLFGIVPDKQVVQPRKKSIFGIRQSITGIKFTPKNANEIPWYMLSSYNSFKRYWNILVVILLMYTAFIMPFRLAFFQPNYFDAWTILDFIIDGLFLIDVLITFITVKKRRDGTFQTSFKANAWRYIRTWLIVDLIACFPFGLIQYLLGDSDPDSNSRYNTAVRLLRVPRMYKLFRVARILKIIKHLKNNRYLDQFQDLLQINSRLYKLIKFLLAQFICVHIMACVWYFSARVQNFGPDTWVVRNDLLDSSNGVAYTAAIYWAFTSITSVGYGDITPLTDLQQFLAILWMIVGVGFYTVTIGSLSSFLSAIDTKHSLLLTKMAALQEFAKETKISLKEKQDIKQSIKHKVKRIGTVWSDKHSLFTDLSKDLKYTIVKNLFGGAAESVWLLNRKDHSFIIMLVPLLVPNIKQSQSILFLEEEYPDQVFILIDGRVNLVASRNIPFKSWIRGSHFGEIQILLKLQSRENTAICYGKSELLQITRSNFSMVLAQFPREKKELMNLAKRRRQLIKQSRMEVERLIRIRVELGEATAPEHDLNFLNMEIEYEEEDDLNTEEIATVSMKKLEQFEERFLKLTKIASEVKDALKKEEIRMDELL